MSVPDGFPRDLLKRPVDDRIRYFFNYTMAHTKLVESAHQLKECLDQPTGTPLIFIFGPTGAGKSTLLRRVQQQLIEEFRKKYEDDRGRIPFAGIEAMAPEFSSFDWKDFYIRALYALQDPFLGSSRGGSHRDTKLNLRITLERALLHRRPHAFYVDEAQNLGKVASGRKLRDQSDCIKSLANLCEVPFVLVGTYELLMLRNLSSQLCRRTVDIHFSRYRADSQKDLQTFRSIVSTFEKHLPLPEIPNLITQWDFCYERSIGCIGILKDWLTRTLAGVLRCNSDARTIMIQDLEQYAPPLDKCMVMAAEIQQEETRLNSGLKRSDLRLALGLDPLIEPDLPKKSRKRNSVGKPSPKRLPIGDKPGAS